MKTVNRKNTSGGSVKNRREVFEDQLKSLQDDIASLSMKMRDPPSGTVALLNSPGRSPGKNNSSYFSSSNGSAASAAVDTVSFSLRIVLQQLMLSLIIDRKLYSCVIFRNSVLYLVDRHCPPRAHNLPTRIPSVS